MTMMASALKKKSPRDGIQSDAAKEPGSNKYASWRLRGTLKINMSKRRSTTSTLNASTNISLDRSIAPSRRYNWNKEAHNDTNASA